MVTRTVVIFCYSVTFLDEKSRVQKVQVGCFTSDAVHFAQKIQPYIDKGWRFRSIDRAWTKQVIDR